MCVDLAGLKGVESRGMIGVAKCICLVVDVHVGITLSLDGS